MNLVLMGPPGSGKGTQASGIAADRGVAHISTGNILRAAVSARTELGCKVETILAAGDLVPDALMMDLIGDRLRQDDAQGGWLLDGYPRTRAQAVGLHEMLERMGQTIDAVLVLDVADDAIVARLGRRLTCRSCGAVTTRPPLDGDVAARRCPSCGKPALYQREDDCEATVRNRLAVYHAQTAPAETALAAHYPLRCISGEGELEIVAQRIRSALG